MFATKILSKELAPYKIRVNALAPGIVSSKMADKMDKQVRERMVKASILKRELRPSEIAKKIVLKIVKGRTRLSHWSAAQKIPHLGEHLQTQTLSPTSHSYLIMRLKEFKDECQA